MLTSSDFLPLPYTPDLIEGGIAYALRSLSNSGATYNRIRRMAAGAAVELAFRRYLTQQNIPYETANAMPFTDPNRYDVSLGGRRCDIKSFFISDRNQVFNMRRDPNLILNAPALVPSDIDAAEGHLDKDLYIFAFVTGSKAAAQKVVEAGQPHCFIHIMPERWRAPQYWNPLGALAFKSDTDIDLQVEISGQNEARDFISQQIHLPPKTRMNVSAPFYSLSAVRIKNAPSARLGIHFPSHKTTHLIPSAEWENIWIYDMQIILAGFITRGDFRQRAKYIPANTRVFQYGSTRTKNLAVPVSSLKPLQTLFARISK